MRSHHSTIGRGSVALLLLLAVATLVVATTGVMQPEHQTFSVAFFLIGLVGTWRQYLNWRRAHSQP